MIYLFLSTFQFARSAIIVALNVFNLEINFARPVFKILLIIDHKKLIIMLNVFATLEHMMIILQYNACLAINYAKIVMGLYQNNV